MDKRGLLLIELGNLSQNLTKLGEKKCTRAIIRDCTTRKDVYPGFELFYKGIQTLVLQFFEGQVTEEEYQRILNEAHSLVMDFSQSLYGILPR